MGESKRRKMAGEYPEYTGKSARYTLCGFVAICKHPRLWGAITTSTLLVPNEDLIDETHRKSVLASLFKQKLSKDFPQTSFADWDGILLAPKVEHTLEELKAAVDEVACIAAHVNREELRKKYGDSAAANYNFNPASDWQDVWADNVGGNA